MSKKFNQGEKDMPLPMPLRQPFPPDEGRVPMKMTFRYESDSDEEEEAEEIEAEVEVEIDEIKAIEPEPEIESEEVKDEDFELIQALESKVLIFKNKQNFQENLENIRGTIPLAQYVSPNGSPRPESPRPESPRKPWADLDKNDLRWLIEGEKQRLLELENHERMLALEKEQSEDGAASGQDWVKRPKAKAKPEPEPEPVMPGLCGCKALCEYYGLCLNLTNYEDIIVTSPIPPRVMDFLNNTI